MKNRIPESELILNPDGSIYHLNLLPDQIAADIITVGDPDRVDHVTKHFDSIEFTLSKREFKTVTGRLGDKRITVISTGIGTDNIDIVFTELDILANVDVSKRIKKEQHKTLRFYRIGTSGALRDDIAVDSTVISRYAVGLDGLLHFYNRKKNIALDQIGKKYREQIKDVIDINPYVVKSSDLLAEKYKSIGRMGVTITATGFYGPQGRNVLAIPKSINFIDLMAGISIDEDMHTTNLEMETAGIYGMSELLGHEAISFNAILANRANQTFSAHPEKTTEKLIVRVLEMMS